MRVLGLDVGSKTIGVACSDALLLTAQAVRTVKRRTLKDDVAELAAICKEREVHHVVVGKPLHMNGDRSINMDGIEELVAALQKKLPETEMVYRDERLTTVMAQRQLTAAGVRGEKRKAMVDTIAAVFILQNYLDAQGGSHG